MKTKKTGANKAGRILISLIGASFVVWGILLIALSLIGQYETAQITEVRREGGERYEIYPGRYTYNLIYTFPINEGEVMVGSTKKIWHGSYVKYPNTETGVYYLKNMPEINALEEDVKPGYGSIVFMTIGVTLIYIVNKQQKTKGRRLKVK